MVALSGTLQQPRLKQPLRCTTTCLIHLLCRPRSKRAPVPPSLPKKACLRLLPTKPLMVKLSQRHHRPQASIGTASALTNESPTLANRCRNSSSKLALCLRMSRPRLPKRPCSNAAMKRSPRSTCKSATGLPPQYVQAALSPDALTTIQVAAASGRPGQPADIMDGVSIVREAIRGKCAPPACLAAPIMATQIIPVQVRRKVNSLKCEFRNKLRCQAPPSLVARTPPFPAATRVQIP